MNKSELVSKVRSVGDLTWDEAHASVNTVLDVISDALRNDSVIIPGFGKFVSRVRPARVMRNPQNGDKLDVPAKRTVSFKASSTLKETVNS